MKKKGVSVIITSYNQGTYLEEAVLSVLKQPVRVSHEIVVVDDGSTDQKTLEVLKSFEAHEGVKVIREQHKGVQYARNIGLQRATFEYVLMMDGDDLLSTNKNDLKNGTYLDHAAKLLTEKKNVVFVHCATKMFGEYSGVTNSSYPLDDKKVLHKHHVPTWIVYRRDEAIGAGGYNPEIQKWQDWSFAVGLLRYRFTRGEKNNIHFLSETLYLYRVHRKDRVSSRPIDELEMTQKTIEGNIEIFVDLYKEVHQREIPKMVLAKKPQKTHDLKHIFVYSPLRALEIVIKRGFFLKK